MIDNTAAMEATTAEGVVIADLEAMVERLADLEEYAADEGYRALEHKAQEARGALTSAVNAMRRAGRDD